jgi:alpha-ketoglutarate-dependent taurine dioxygenase
MKIWFFCLQPSEEGGETPLADSRRVYDLLGPELRQRFVERGVMYVRNYRRGVSLSWEEVFQTSDPASVEQYCRRSGIEFRWVDISHLQTWQVRQAVATHPLTDETIWFNQAHLFHVSTLSEKVRKSMVEVFQDGQFPRQSYYGDSSPIEEETLLAITAAYDRATVSFPWEKGDLLLLDNMLVAHGRASYKGARKVAVAMAEPYTTAANARRGQAS